MFEMFFYSKFNQNITNWITSSVTDMRRMFYNTNFNQDLSKWDVNKVAQCFEFSLYTFEWTLPKPKFTNCTP
jgi:surface protein